MRNARLVAIAFAVALTLGAVWAGVALATPRTDFCTPTPGGPTPTGLPYCPPPVAPTRTPPWAAVTLVPPRLSPPTLATPTPGPTGTLTPTVTPAPTGTLTPTETPVPTPTPTPTPAPPVEVQIARSTVGDTVSPTVLLDCVYPVAAGNFTATLPVSLCVSFSNVCGGGMGYHAEFYVNVARKSSPVTVTALISYVAGVDERGCSVNTCPRSFAEIITRTTWGEKVSFILAPPPNTPCGGGTCYSDRAAYTTDSVHPAFLDPIRYPTVLHLKAGAPVHSRSEVQFAAEIYIFAGEAPSPPPIPTPTPTPTPSPTPTPAPCTLCQPLPPSPIWWSVDITSPECFTLVPGFSWEGKRIFGIDIPGIQIPEVQACVRWVNVDGEFLGLSLRLVITAAAALTAIAVFTSFLSQV